MIRWLIFFMLFSTQAWAGIAVCRSGSNITSTALSSPIIPGCEFYDGEDRTEYDRVKSIIRTTSRKYLKWTTQLEEMSQAEKDAVDQTQADLLEAAVRGNAKNSYEGFQEEGLKLRALVRIILDELNVLRGLHSLPARTMLQVRTAIDNQIDSGGVDQ